MTIQTLGFIGGGNMAAHLIAGFQQAPSFSIAVYDQHEEKTQQLAQELGVTPHTSLEALVSGSDALVLAVKPQHLLPLCATLKPLISSQHTYCLSIAAGISLQQISSQLGCSVPLVRAMPNLGVKDGLGAIGFFAKPEDRTHLQEHLTPWTCLGYTTWLKEEDALHTLTALSGSGPAYFFLMMEALISAATAMGLTPEQAYNLTTITAKGAAHLATVHPDLATLREQVTSKGGTTAAGLAALNTGGFSDLLASALQAAHDQSIALSEEA